MSEITNGNSACNTTCFYGESRVGKSREVGTMARYVYERTGKLTRLIHCDGGGWEVIQPEIDAGLIIPLRLSGHPDFWNWILQVSRGFWPVNDDLSGKLVKYNDHPDHKQIGLYAIEGIAAICQESLNWMIRKKVKVSSDVVGYQKVATTSGENSDPNLIVEIGAASEGHYGNVMTLLFDVMRNFSRLNSYGLEEILWTSLEAGGVEKVAGMQRSVLGVGAIGKAITPALPAKLGDLIHFDRAVDNKGKVEYRAYFTPHEDKELGGRTWPSSMRFPPQASNALAKDTELGKGYLVLTDEDGSNNRIGISKLFRWRDEHKAKATEAIKAMMAARREKENNK